MIAGDGETVRKGIVCIGKRRERERRDGGMGTMKSLTVFIYIYIYMYGYICICVVCVYRDERVKKGGPIVLIEYIIGPCSFNRKQNIMK